MGHEMGRATFSHPARVSAPETLTFVLRYRVRGGMRLGEEQDAVLWRTGIATSNPLIVPPS